MDFELVGEAGALDAFDDVLEDYSEYPDLIVRNGTHYGPYVEYGTDPHVITPDTAEALAFPGSGGGIVFAQRVEHPGTDPQPFWRPAFDATEAQLARLEQQTDTLADYQRAVAETMYGEARFRTPVDEGRLRSNWEIDTL